MAEFFIPGPAGPIQARLDTPPSTEDNSAQTNTQNICAILCHPHPQYGGSMLDGVLQTAADVLLSKDINTMRFNFRGVGQSGGTFDQGRGEMDDLLAVHTYVLTEHAPETIWWVGYSFGAAMVWQALQHASPQQALLIAPPVGMMAFSAADQPLPPIAAIAGDADSFVNLEALHTLSGIDVHILAGADHFFSGCHHELATVLRQVLT